MINQNELREFVDREVYCCQSILVDELLKKGIFSYEDIENLYQTCQMQGRSEQDKCEECQMLTRGEITSRESGYDDEEAQEIYEWWVVSDWLAQKLKEQGEPIIENDYGTWWGRTTTGQAIFLDGVIDSIYTDLL